MTRIKIDNELYHVKEVLDYGLLPMIETEEGEEFYLAKDHEKAGEMAREYWENMAQDDPKEFACIVGEKTLVNWGLGILCGPGSTYVTSLENWLDLWLDTPEEQWASYDSEERTVDRVGILAKELDFIPTVAYRHN